jgi:hypothetical protein
MDVQTDIKDNWIIDIDYSNKSPESVQTQIALGAISTQIGESKNLIEYKYTNFNNKFDNILFNLPENIISKPKERYRNYIYNSQKWIGHVIELSEASFIAKLEDKYDPTTYEIAEFEVEDVSEDDLGLLKLGAVFYWFVGYVNQDGRVFKQSLVRFKRVVDFTESEIDFIADEANELNDSLIWD